MALYSVKPLYSASATVTNGSDIVQVTGNVNCSFLQSGAIVSVSGSSGLVDAVSGTGVDGSGNSTIKLRRPWPGATITGQMLVFMSYEGLADAVFQLKSLIDAAAAEVEGAFSFKGDYDLAAAETLPTNPAEGAGSEMWRISTTATVGSVLYRAGDLIFYDQYLTVWRKVAENLGTAAYLNKGTEVGNIPDNAQLNTRLGTTGNLGNAAQAAVVSSPTDTTTDRVLKVGASKAQLGADVYARSNVLGVVSQSAGVPTGAIIEQGSNANGTYTKYADGTLICEVRTTYNDSSGTTWTFPSVFNNIPSVVSGHAGGATNSLLVAMNAPTNTSVVYTVIISTTATAFTTNSRVDFIAKGRWY